MALSSLPKTDAAKKERVNVSLASDLLDALDSEAARRKMDRSALLTEYARTGLHGGVAPAPVVVSAPTAEENAAAVVDLLTKTSMVGTVAADPLSPSRTAPDDQGDKLKAIYVAVLTQTELVKDAIAARHIERERRGIVARLMGRKRALVDGVTVVEDAYAVAKDKARRQMGLSQ